MDLRPNSTLQKGGKKRGSGVYRGVRFRKDRWISEIRVPKTPTRIWLGSHLSPEKAARAYDAALYCLRGEMGIFNFPNDKRPDLGNRPIGSLTCDEIHCIAQKFSSMEEERVDKSTSPPMELSPPEEIPQAVESSVVPIWEINGQSSANKVDISEEPCIEPYIPTFEPEVVPFHDPDFVPDGEYLAEKYMELEQWGVLDEDWLRYSQNTGL